MPETDTQGEELRETIEYYLVHDQVPEDVREEVLALYDEGEYRRALEVTVNNL